MKDFLQRVKSGLKTDFTFKHADFKYTLIFCGILAVLIIISLFVPFFIWVTLVVAIALAFLSKGGRALYIPVFMFSFIHVWKPAGVAFQGLPLFNFLLPIVIGWLLLKYIIAVCKKQKQMDWLPTVFTIFLIFLLLMPFSFAFSFDGLLSIEIAFGIMQVVAVVYVAYLYRADFNLKELFVVLFAGIFVSFAFGWIAYLPQLERVYEMVLKAPNRYGGLNAEMNLFANDVLVALIVLMVLFFNGVMRTFFYPAFVFLSVCLIVTGSKAGFLIMAMVLAVYGVMCLVRSLRSKDKSYLYHAMATVGIYILLCLVFFDITKHMFWRFGTERMDGVGYLDNLTTFRFGIWMGYLEAIFSSWQTAIFGHGVCAPWLAVSGEGHGPISAHNSFLTVIYHIGLFGMFVIALFALLLLLRIVKNKQMNWWNVAIVFIVIGVTNMHLTTIVFGLSIHLIVLCPALTYKGEEVEHNLKDAKRGQRG